MMKKYFLGSLLVCLLTGLSQPLTAYSLETDMGVKPIQPHSEDQGLQFSLYDQYTFHPRAARRRAAVRKAIRRNRESGFSVQYVDSRLKEQTDTFTGNLWLFGLERRFRFPLSNFYAGGKLAGGTYVNGGGVTGGLGYGGGQAGFEFGHRPFRLSLGSLFGVGGIGIHETRSRNDVEETYHLSRGFVILEPEVALLLTTSPFSTLKFGASYQYIHVGDGLNLGGPSVSLSFLFSRL